MKLEMKLLLWIAHKNMKINVKMKTLALSTKFNYSKVLLQLIFWHLKSKNWSIAIDCNRPLYWRSASYCNRRTTSTLEQPAVCFRVCSSADKGAKQQQQQRPTIVGSDIDTSSLFKEQCWQGGYNTKAHRKRLFDLKSVQSSKFESDPTRAMKMTKKDWCQFSSARASLCVSDHNNACKSIQRQRGKGRQNYCGNECKDNNNWCPKMFHY